MFCPKCGAELKEDSKFCSHCGTALERVGKVEQDEAHQGTAIGEMSEFKEFVKYFDDLRGTDIRPMLRNNEFLSDILNKAGEAIKCFADVLKLNPQHKDAWYYKGYALGVSLKFKKAIKCFDKVLKIVWQKKSRSAK
ncbi:MAG: zinc-ribbon domain-containing protein [Halobacteriota archaeon]